MDRRMEQLALPTLLVYQSAMAKESLTETWMVPLRVPGSHFLFLSVILLVLKKETLMVTKTVKLTAIH